MKAFVEEAFVSPHLCVLRTRVPGETLWVLLGGDARGSPDSTPRSAFGTGVLGHDAKKAHFSGRAPRGHVRDAARSRALEGGTLTRLGKKSVTVETAAGRSLLVLRGHNVVLLTNEAPNDAELTLDAARDAGDAIARAVTASAMEIFRADLVAALKKSIACVERRVLAVAKDLAAMEKADGMQLAAQWLLPIAGAAKRGQTELVAIDYAAEPPREIRVALDPSRSPKEQVDAMFKRARRLHAGRAYAEPRHRDAVAQREKLRALLAEAKGATSLEALANLADAARLAAPKDFTLETTREGDRKGERASRKEDAGERGYRVYSGAGGARILVGRTSRENDVLTFKVARPHDVWLHAKARRGAHVVVPRERGEGIPQDLLVDAAHLAAHFSEARDEAVVDVEYTHRKFLRKPKGGAPGLVVVEREKVIAVRIEKPRLDALLGAGA